MKSTSSRTLQVSVPCDEITLKLSQLFDYKFEGQSSVRIPQFTPPAEYQIGLIVGPSGSGKSTLLREIGVTPAPEWEDEKAIASHFQSADDAQERLSGVGFNSIPAWMRPYRVLSTGEKFRADMARMLATDSVIDEFTSVVDRNVAKSCAYAVQRFIRKNNLQRVTFATCHYDVAEWLQPDWMFDTPSEQLLARGCLQRPQRIVDLTPCDSKHWPIFSAHHYLTEDINRSARCWAATWEGRTVGFVSALAYPNGYIKNAWREHRTVALPDFQGMGIGVRISDAMATIFVKDGCRFFSKTAHPRMGEYRNNSPLWRPTSKNMRARTDYNHNRKTKESSYKHLHMNRFTYSHEFIGDSS
jgi:ABC-type lipoprotein export system ATPase subunit/GNAT superfamily N-acetyltransferase